MKKQAAERFFADQMGKWPQVAARYAELEGQLARTLRSTSADYRVVFNPARVRSVTAKVSSPAPVDKDKCILCAANRPAEQTAMPLGENYILLVNPFPIFRRHFTIAATRHSDQQIETRFADMLEMAESIEGYTILYNGPGSGASVPGHAHFQAIERGELPLERNLHTYPTRTLATSGQSCLKAVDGADFPLLVIEASARDEAVELLGRLFGLLTDSEKRMNNLIAWYEGGKWTVIVILRGKHRPRCYDCMEDDQLIISPATVEMGGVIVTIRQEDYEKLDLCTLTGILGEVALPTARFEEITAKLRQTRQRLRISAGIIEANTIEFNLHTPYLLNGEPVSGLQKATLEQGKVHYNGQLYDELLFAPCNEDEAWVEVSDVTIGKQFHWEQQQNQRFRGWWKVIAGEDYLTGINLVDIEEYLKSVISSEMSANAPAELLKAHTVIARSWVMSQIEGNKQKETTDSEGLRWYDSNGHTNYHVCSDDHCQRYQGINRISNPAAVRAVAETCGEVLMAGGEILDTRYSKCCGGMTEEYQYVWGTDPGTPQPYVQDSDDTDPTLQLYREEDATRWIHSSPKAWCNVTDPSVLSVVLNDFDQQTPDFFRWEVTYPAARLAEILHTKTGIDFGEITAITPLERGFSGRIWKIRIEGTLQSITTGKELEIRRILSEKHLYSSAFTVETAVDGMGKITSFTFRGAGWGHGVGLCQIGAANMAANGYAYTDILHHYYRRSDILKVYE